jgi:hypothetical protein
VFEYEAVVCVNSDHVRELCDAAESLAADHDPAQALIEWLRLVGARATVSSGLAAAMAAGEDGGTAGSLQSCHAMIAAAGVLCSSARSVPEPYAPTSTFMISSG